MATKKATTKAAPKKKAPAKKTAPKKAVAAKVAEKNVEVESKLPRPGALIAEFLGAFVLTGAFFALFASGTDGIIGISLVLIVLVIVFGAISHAHFNPAISIALWANRKIGGVKTLLYIVAQVFGAMLAFLVFKAIFAASNGVDIFSGSEALIIDNLINKQGITQEMIDEAGGLAQFAQANGFSDLAQLAERIGIQTFVDNNISGKGLTVFFSELIGAIIFGLGVGVAYFKRSKPVVKALALGFGLFAGLVVGGSAVILNPAVAGALGSFSHGWGGDVADVMWPIVAYVVATIAGVIIGSTAYRYMLKDSCCCGDSCPCDGKDCGKQCDSSCCKK
ncbi:MAG: aquaporin [Candidatus Nomurabacteria bacterium]|jgi:glycerol uptake facilitator-like aquaporin|nr:aquaporin [Candidatus Nomurabacteria bacterium]